MEELEGLEGPEYLDWPYVRPTGTKSARINMDNLNIDFSIPIVVRPTAP